MSKDGVYVCAEIGVNWMGDKERLWNMIRACGEAEADAVKLQMFNEEVISSYPDELIEKLEPMILDSGDVLRASELAHNLDMELVVTPMYYEAVEYLQEMGDAIDGVKIRAKDWTNMRLRAKASELDLPTYVSVPHEEGQVFNKDHISAGLFRQVYASTRGPKTYRIYCIPKYPPVIADYYLNNVVHHDGVSLHSSHWDIHYAAAVLAVNAQYYHGTKRRFYVEPHVTIYSDRCIDYAVSIHMKDLRSLCKAVWRLEGAIG